LSDYTSKLQHLTAEQIEALYAAYIGGEKIAVLLERYAIDIAPSSLIKAFAPVPCAEHQCPYCNVPLFERRRSRSAHSFNDNMAYCTQCQHRYFYPGRSQWHRECTCAPCLTARELAKQQRALEKRKRIQDHWCLGKRPPVPLDRLSITHRLQLLALLEVRMDAQRDCIQAAETATDDARVSPSAHMDTEILLALHVAHVLLVDPDSPLAAFSDDAMPKAWQNKVRWVANVSLEGTQRAGVGGLYRALHAGLSSGAQAQWRDEVGELIRQVCIEEVCAYVANRCAEHGLPFEARKKAAQVTAQLLEVHPVRHIWSLANTAVRGALSYVARAQVSKRQASNSIPGSMLSLSDRAVREQWQFNSSSYDGSGPRSGLSQALFDVLLQQVDHGLQRRVADYLAELPLAGAGGGGAWFCSMCGSGLVHVEHAMAQTVVNCKDCLARTRVAT